MILFLYHPFSTMDVLFWKRRMLQEYNFNEVYFADNPDTLFSLIGAYGVGGFFTIALTCWSEDCVGMLEIVSRFYPDTSYWILPKLTKVRVSASEDAFVQTSPLCLLTHNLPPSLSDHFRQQEEDAYVSFRKQKGDAMLKQNILYVESNLRQITVHSLQTKNRYYQRLDVAEEQLGSSFVRCHQSYLVNLRHIWKMTEESFLLYNGCTIPISRSRRAKSAMLFTQYRLTRTNKRPQS